MSIRLPGGSVYDDDFELEFEFEEGIEAGHTVVPNLFITRFMPKAPGNYVKIYLAGLMRCFGNRNSQFVSAKTLAEEQGVSVRAVQRAWSYWEERRLIRRVPRYLRDLKNPRDYKLEPDLDYKYQSSNLIIFRDKRHWIVIDEEENVEGDSLSGHIDEQGDRTNVGRGDTTVTRGGVTGVTRGGDTGVTLRNTNREEYMSEGEREKGQASAVEELAASTDLPLVTSDSLPHDEPGIDYEMIIAAARRAGILMFDGQLRTTCELAAIRGMDARVIAACIDDAKALEAQKSPRTPMWKWAAAFVRSAFEGGVRTLEDYQRFKEQKAQEARPGGRAPVGGRRPSQRGGGWFKSDNLGDLEIDWSKWGQPGDDER